MVYFIRDDGAGFDRENILQKAIASELTQKDIQLQDFEIFNFIFEPGFSAEESVYKSGNYSMDMVKHNIAALRGVIEVDSQVGKGTTFRICVPLTLAIIDGFLVGVDSSSFVVPLDMVLECVELKKTNNKTDDDRHYFNLRGEVLPIIRLRELFSIKGQPTNNENVVVVQYGGNKAGLVVDALLGEFQTVIKPLGKIFSHINGIGGSTILGNGQVALIIDVPGLVQQVSQLEKQAVVTAA